jgi:hypothetical protein
MYRSSAALGIRSPALLRDKCARLQAFCAGAPWQLERSEDESVSLRTVFAASLVLLLSVGAMACSGGDAGEGSPHGTTASSSVTSFAERTIDTWHVGDDAKGAAAHVSGILRQDGACSTIEIDGHQQAVTWPPGSSRTDEGIRVGELVHPFDKESQFTVVQGYNGPQRPVTCVTATAWLVTK